MKAVCSVFAVKSKITNTGAFPKFFVIKNAMKFFKKGGLADLKQMIFEEFLQTYLHQKLTILLAFTL